MNKQHLKSDRHNYHTLTNMIKPGTLIDALSVR